MYVCMYVCVGCSRGAVGVQGGNRSQGVPKIATKSEDEKRGGPFNSLALLGAILEENRLQDGARNRSKINILAINFQSFFLIHF